MSNDHKITPKCYSIPEFCDAHGISRGSYYNLEKEGKAPATLRVGRRKLISDEAATAWRAAMTAESAEG